MAILDLEKSKEVTDRACPECGHRRMKLTYFSVVPESFPADGGERWVAETFEACDVFRRALDRHGYEPRRVPDSFIQSEYEVSLECLNCRHTEDAEEGIFAFEQIDSFERHAFDPAATVEPDAYCQGCGGGYDLDEDADFDLEGLPINCYLEYGLCPDCYRLLTQTELNLLSKGTPFEQERVISLLKQRLQEQQRKWRVAHLEAASL